MSAKALPVAVIGAGPVGLAAAAHLVTRGETPVVLEAGERVGAAVRQWGHVRVFSPWRCGCGSTTEDVAAPAAVRSAPLLTLAAPPASAAGCCRP